MKLDWSPLLQKDYREWQLKADGSPAHPVGFYHDHGVGGYRSFKCERVVRQLAPPAGSVPVSSRPTSTTATCEPCRDIAKPSTKDGRTFRKRVLRLHQKGVEAFLNPDALTTAPGRTRHLSRGGYTHQAAVTGLSSLGREVTRLKRTSRWKGRGTELRMTRWMDVSLRKPPPSCTLWSATPLACFLNVVGQEQEQGQAQELALELELGQALVESPVTTWATFWTTFIPFKPPSTGSERQELKPQLQKPPLPPHVWSDMLDAALGLAVCQCACTTWLTASDFFSLSLTIVTLCPSPFSWFTRCFRVAPAIWRVKSARRREFGVGIFF